MKIPEEFFDIAFGKSVAFGYRTEDVDEFVTKAIQIIKELNEENEDLQKKMEVLAGSLEKYREDEDSLRSALIGAQKLGDSILKDSRSKAEIILRDATTKAEHIVEEAHTRLEIEKSELERVKAEASQFKENLIAIYKSHLDVIKRIPAQEVARKRAEMQQEEAQAPVVQPAAEPVQQAAVRQPEPQPPVVMEEPEPQPVSRRASPEPEETVREFVPARQAPKKPAIQLELMDDDFEEDEDEDSVVSNFSSRIDKIISQPSQQRRLVFGEDDEEMEETAPARPGKKSIVSSKFGILKFGDSFDLEDD